MGVAGPVASAGAIARRQPATQTQCNDAARSLCARGGRGCQCCEPLRILGRGPTANGEIRVSGLDSLHLFIKMPSKGVARIPPGRSRDRYPQDNAVAGAIAISLWKTLENLWKSRGFSGENLWKTPAPSVESLGKTGGASAQRIRIANVLGWGDRGAAQNTPQKTSGHLRALGRGIRRLGAIAVQIAL